MASCCIFNPSTHVKKLSTLNLSNPPLYSQNSFAFSLKQFQNGTQSSLRINATYFPNRIAIRCNLNDENTIKPATKVSKSGVGFGSPEDLTPKGDVKASKKNDENIKRFPSPEKPLLSTVSQTDVQFQDIDTISIRFLTFLFSIIILQGISLAASGFLPEEWDAFIVDYLYPSFSPMVGLFLALAASYGLFKFLDPK